MLSRYQYSMANYIDILSKGIDETPTEDKEGNQLQVADRVAQMVEVACFRVFTCVFTPQCSTRAWLDAAMCEDIDGGTPRQLRRLGALRAPQDDLFVAALLQDSAERRHARPYRLRLFATRASGDTLFVVYARRS